MAKETYAQLRAALDDLKKRHDERIDELLAARQAKASAEKSLADSREHFADLKERLASTEAETARLRGYLERVHEDDVVREGMVEIEDEQGKRMVPKRPSPMISQQSVSYAGGGSSFDNFGRPNKKTHWTSY
jgi:chromosome segregation ATPase